MRLQVVEDLGVGQVRGKVRRGAGLGEAEVCRGCVLAARGEGPGEAVDRRTIDVVLENRGQFVQQQHR